MLKTPTNQPSFSKFSLNAQPLNFFKVMEQLSKFQLNQFSEGGGHFDTIKGPILFCGYRPHLLIDFDDMLHGSL